MNELREKVVHRILEARSRQSNLPGSEWDAKNTPNDWVAIISHYVNEEVRHKGLIPNRADFEDSLIKAAGVIIAALEHCDFMESRKELR